MYSDAEMVSCDACCPVTEAFLKGSLIRRTSVHNNQGHYDLLHCASSIHTVKPCLRVKLSLTVASVVAAACENQALLPDVRGWDSFFVFCASNQNVWDKTSYLKLGFLLII